MIVRRTRYRLRKANERAHILRGLVKALDALDEVIALIRASETVDIARQGLIELLDVDEIQAQAILDMQLRRLAALERQRIIDDLAKIEAEIADLEDILAKPERQRRIVRDELAEIVDKHGDDRRTRIVAADGEVSDEDLIAREDVVVTITETGYAKRTKTDLYRSQKRGGKGFRGGPQAGRHRRALFRVLHPRLDPVLHQPGPGLSGQGLRVAGGRPHGARPACSQPAGIPAGGAHRPGHPDPQLHRRPVSGVGHAQRFGEEVQAHRVRFQPVGRDCGDQPARRRRTCRRGAVFGRRRPAAGVGQWPVHPVLGKRRSVAADGPSHLRCAGDAVQHRRPVAVAECGPGRHLSIGRHLGRLRQAHRDRGISGARAGGKGVLTVQYDPRRGKLVGP
ncbi:DNA gyrase/topoisomerase IV, subunit A family protein [Mycobacterium xenopi 3993]|nr:DNA gyrase/topoisomerase IV, subunit A family protein [Mycobacterium xenopi 3993]